MVFTQRFERTVDRDNTVRFRNLVMQIERAESTHSGRMQGHHPSAPGHHPDTDDR